MQTPPRPPQQIPYGRHFLDEQDIQAVVEVLRHGALTQGPKIAEFERAVASYVGARYAVALSSGTAALHLACLAAGLGSDDYLVTTPNSFVASANCALFVGATPILADIDPQSLNPDAAHIEKAVHSKKVKVILPVHFGGLPCDMARIQATAKMCGAVIIEDACHAFGARYPDGGRVGNCAMSQMTVFSFHPVKAIAAGEGGMVTTNDAGLYERLVMLRTHGIRKSPQTFVNKQEAFSDGQPNPWYYEMQELGFNYRITDIQAALALSQLNKIELFLERRRVIAGRYDASLADIPGVTLMQKSGRDFSAHHLYVIGLDWARIGMNRQRFMKKLSDAGIACQVHYIPIHYQPYYNQHLGFKKGQFPAAEAYYDRALSLPIYYSLTDDDQAYVIETLRRFLT